MNVENRIYKTLETFTFFKIEVIADLEFENKIYKNVRQYNNDSLITLENWEHYKENFFEQRMNTYNQSYLLAEKIKLEIEKLEALTTNENEYKILKDRYSLFLSEKTEQPQQNEVVKPDEVKKEMHLKIFVENAFDMWEQMFCSFKIDKTKRTDLSFMYEVMLYNKLIHKTVSKKNIEDWINETYKFEIDKIHYTNIKTTANEKRMATYNLLKQLK